MKKMKILDENFQDALLMECIEFINEMRPLLELINNNEDGEFDLGYHFPNINVPQLQLSTENFADLFFKKQFERFKEKYELDELDEYMSFKSGIYEAD